MFQSKGKIPILGPEKQAEEYKHMKLMQSKCEAKAIKLLSLQHLGSTKWHPSGLSQTGLPSFRDSYIELKISFHTLPSPGFFHGAVIKVTTNGSVCFSMIWMLIFFLSSKVKLFFFFFKQYWVRAMFLLPQYALFAVGQKWIPRKACQNKACVGSTSSEYTCSSVSNSGTSRTRIHFDTVEFLYPTLL